jgi:hypothetical protein
MAFSKKVSRTCLGFTLEKYCLAAKRHKEYSTDPAVAVALLEQTARKGYKDLYFGMWQIGRYLGPTLHSALQHDPVAAATKMVVAAVEGNVNWHTWRYLRPDIITDWVLPSNCWSQVNFDEKTMTRLLEQSIAYGNAYAIECLCKDYQAEKVIEDAAKRMLLDKAIERGKLRVVEEVQSRLGLWDDDDDDDDDEEEEEEEEAQDSDD